MAQKMLLFLILATCWATVSAQPVCNDPIAEQAVDTHFQSLAYKQLLLEFGDEDLRVFGMSHAAVGRDMIRVQAYASFRKPGRADESRIRITGWVSRCDGTVIIRGNTWLANGILDVPRFTHAQLPGRGLVLGHTDAPTKVIAYVDSRCPQCHRLIAYARELAKDGIMQVEIRQIAMLESTHDAIACRISLSG